MENPRYKIIGISGEMLKPGESMVAFNQQPDGIKRWSVSKLEERSHCTNNYRDVSLLRIPCKIYARVLDGRVRSELESKVM